MTIACVSKILTSTKLLLILIFFGFYANSIHAASTDPRSRVDFWRNNFTEMKVNEDPNVATAFNVFERLLNTAGSRPGIEPRLLVIRENPSKLNLPIAIPDGWIILSLSVLEFCFQQNKGGLERLAFILGHELAHQLDNDFWHMRVLELMAFSQESVNSPHLSTEIRHIINRTDNIKTKELKADELGILYATTAGYDISSIINNSQNKNFFQQWMDFTNPERVRGNSPNYHPNPDQRTLVSIKRLQSIADKASLFTLGNWMYITGNYVSAIKVFDLFRQDFPSREVHHNLATSYHMQAIQCMQKMSITEIPDFLLSDNIDLNSRADMNRNVPYSILEKKRCFKSNITAAIKYYKLAIQQDKNYFPSYKNLASAYIIHGEPYAAIALLLEALKFNDSDPQTHNLLGVAFYKGDNHTKSKLHFDKSLKINPNSPSLIFNYGKYLHEKNQASDSNIYWQRYVDKFPESKRSQHLKAIYKSSIKHKPQHKISNTIDKEPIAVNNLRVGLYEDEIPRDLLEQLIGSNEIKNTPYKLLTLENGIIITLEDDEIIFINFKKKLQGKGTVKLTINTPKKLIFKNYGMPHKIVTTVKKSYYIYQDKKVALEMSNDLVDSILLF